MTHLLQPRRLLLVALTAALMFAAALALAPRGEASFTTTKCLGEEVLGRGASFAAAAQNAWEFNFQTFFCADVGTSPNITYDPAGSGAGITAMGQRNPAAGQPRFAGTDDPPDTTQVNTINAGTAAVGDEGQIHVVPAAVGAVAPLVNLPAGCDQADIDELPAAQKTDAQNLDADATDDDTVRVRFTKAQWESAWEGGTGNDSWGDIFEAWADNAGCGDVAITRVVRFDRSGSTFTEKDYLDTIDPLEGWTDQYHTGTNDNREWPNATFGPRADCDTDGPGGNPPPNGPGSQDDAVDHLTSSCSGNATNLTNKLITTDGSIGYADIATARNGGLAITPEGNDNDTYWTQLQNGSGTFTEPTTDAARGFRTDVANRGANCNTTAFHDVPASTLGSWFNTSGVNSPAGYGVCTLTYGLVFDDYADPYGGAGFNPTSEESRARTVKDYWTSIVSDGGQALLSTNDYAPLPPGILAIARTGVTAVDWNKTGGGGGGGGGGNTPPPPPGDNTPPPPPAAPSNVFSVPGTTISSKSGNATLSIRVPGAGVIEVVATANLPRASARARIARVRLTVSRAGTYKATLKPSTAAKKVLRRKGRLKVSVRITYTPRGGSARSSTRSVTLKLKRRGNR